MTPAGGEAAAEATRRVRTRILGTDGRIDAAKLESQQHAAHGLAWLATYAEAVAELGGYAERLQAEGRFGETEEIAALVALGLSNKQIADRMSVSVRTVEGHVYRACFKLDVADRDSLAGVVNDAQVG